VEPLAPPTPAPPAPRSLGQILDTSFDVVRRHWVVLVGLSALVYIPATFLEAALPEDPKGALEGAAPWMLVALAFTIVALPVVMAAVTDACGDFHRQRPTDAGRALRRGLALALPLVGTYLVMGLVALAAVLPLLLVIALWDSLGFARVPAAGLAVALPFVVLLRLSLLTQVAVLEHRFGPGALARANRLIEGQVLRVFGVYLVVGLLMGVLGGAAGLALGALPAIGPVATGLVQALAFAYTTAVGVAVYEDVRARKGEPGTEGSAPPGEAERSP
jgi:hypothetical protein